MSTMARGAQLTRAALDTSNTVVLTQTHPTLLPFLFFPLFFVARPFRPPPDPDVIPELRSCRPTGQAECMLMEGGTLVVSFGTTWCGPCAILAPELETAATALEDYDDITIAKVSSFNIVRASAVSPSRRPATCRVGWLSVFFSFPTICHTSTLSPPSSLFSRFILYVQKDSERLTHRGGGRIASTAAVSTQTRHAAEEPKDSRTPRRVALHLPLSLSPTTTACLFLVTYLTGR